MTEVEERRLAAALNGLAEILDTPLSPGRLAGYVLALEGAPLDDLCAAIGQAARTCAYYPRPAELLTLVREGRLTRLAQQREEDQRLRLEASAAEATERAAQQARTDAAFELFKAEVREILGRHTMPAKRRRA